MNRHIVTIGKRSSLRGDCFALLCLLFIALTAAFIYSPKEACAQKVLVRRSPVIRVCVIKEALHLKLSIKSEFKITPLEVNDVLCTQKYLKSSLVEPMSWGLKIDDVEFKLYGIRIFPAADSAIFVNNRPFRGEVDIIRQADQTLLVVNHINLEDYLRGVLYNEVSHWWPLAAIEAQAIAARTFALYQAGINKNKDYDLDCTAYSQVYGGAGSERRRTDKAVYRTAGKVLTFRGRIFPAYYHATCAGRTEDASVLWKTDLPVLKGVACGFCRVSPHFFWKRKIPLEDVEKALLLKDVRQITPKETDKSGRIVSLAVKTQDKTVYVPAKDFRQRLGSNVIKSTIFKIDIRPQPLGKTFVYIEGSGWGHGVGMCQWGAFGMAMRGFSADDILRHYYPGAKIELYNGITKPQDTITKQ